MNSTIRRQLEALKSLEFLVDGIPSTDIPDSFSTITFKQSSSATTANEKVNVIFENYILKPFEGFDFHDKFNKGIAPQFKYMTGEILKKTEKMYFFKLQPAIVETKVCAHCFKPGDFKPLCKECAEKFKELDKIYWCGWCPRKSCTVY